MAKSNWYLEYFKKQVHPLKTQNQIDYRKKCPICGEPYGNDEEECSSCGFDFSLICPRCDTVVDPEDSFCPVCGLDLVNFIVCPNCNCVYDAEYECPECEMVFYDNVERYRRHEAYQRRCDAIESRIIDMEMEEKYPTRTSGDDLLNYAYRGGSVTPR